MVNTARTYQSRVENADHTACNHCSPQVKVSD